MSDDNSLGKITTEEEALAVVKQDGWDLEYVPENLKTADVCLEAVKQNGEVLQWVPEKLRDEVRAALKNTTHLGLK